MASFCYKISNITPHSGQPLIVIFYDLLIFTLSLQSQYLNIVLSLYSLILLRYNHLLAPINGCLLQLNPYKAKIDIELTIHG